MRLWVSIEFTLIKLTDHISELKSIKIKRGSREDMAAVASPQTIPSSNDQHNILIDTDPAFYSS